MTETLFGLIRHGATRANMEKRIQGQTDSPLTDEAVVRARAWGRCLAGDGFGRILRSPLGRARHTADLVNETLGLPVYEDARLMELDWGDWVGRTVSDIRAENPERLAALEARGFDFRPPGGESRREHHARARAALMDAHARWPGERVLVVCHNGTIKALVYELSGRLFLPSDRRALRDRHLHRVAAGPEGLRLVRENALDLDGASGCG